MDIYTYTARYGCMGVCRGGLVVDVGAKEVDRHTDRNVYSAHLHTTTNQIQDSNQPI